MNTTRVDWAAVKADFPVLQRMIDGQRLVYLDSANTSQKPNAVIDAMTDFMRNGYAPINRSAYRMTIDCLDDYLSMRQVFHGVSDPVGIAWTDLVARVERGLFQARTPTPVGRFVMGTVQLGLRYGISRAQTDRPAERQAGRCALRAAGCRWPCGDPAPARGSLAAAAGRGAVR